MSGHPFYGRAADAPPAAGLALAVERSTAFVHPDAESLRATLAGERPGEIYPRYGHPAGRALEAAVARLEAADGAVSFASGMAAFTALVLGLVDSGQAIAVARQVYGGVDSLLLHDLPRLGYELRRFDGQDPDSLAAVLTDGRVRLVHVESPTNPLCRVVDLAALAGVAQAAGALLSVDATFLPPPLQRPLNHGVDLVLHSATKWLGGHSDVLAGIVSGRHELLARLEGFRRRSGAVLAPDAAWLVHRSLPTLELRARRASDSAARVAAHLAGEAFREILERVHYPGLTGHPDHEVARRQMDGFGALLALELRGGLAAATAVYDRLRRVTRAVSLGGVESVASLPVHTSHSYLDEAGRAAAGIADGLLRISIGLEAWEDLAADLEQALLGGGVA